MNDKRFIKQWIVGCVGIFLATLPLQAQQAENKNTYRLDRLRADNPWLGARNAAGLIFNRFQDISYVEAGFRTETGDFRNLTDPTSLFNTMVRTESYRQLNRLFVYGNFEFNYAHRQNKTWSNMLYPETTSFQIADSTPGRQTLESYRLNGGLGLELGEQWAVGLDLRYFNASNAKKRDIRNSNTYMELALHPGILFRTEHIRLGLNLNYERLTEKIENKMYGENTTHTLFLLEGLWYYSPFTFSSNSTVSRQIENDGLGGTAQLELVFNNFRFFNQFSGTRTDQKIWVNHVRDERGGEMEITDYRYLGNLSLASGSFFHELKGYATFTDKLGYENIQRSEQVDGSSVWVQYGKKNKNVREEQLWGVQYTLFRDRARLDNNWSATIGVDRNETTLKYRLYPVTATQKQVTTTINRSFRKNFALKRGRIDCLLSYDQVLGDGYKQRLSSEDPAWVLAEGFYPQLADQLDQEFEYLTADTHTGTVNARYTHFLNARKGQSIYADALFRITGGLNENRSSFSLMLGFSF